MSVVLAKFWALIDERYDLSVRGDADVALQARIKAIAAVRIRYGQRRIHILLRREGWPVNIKRVARLYREAGLAIDV